MTRAAGGYPEGAVRAVLTATDEGVDATVAHEALLLACAGATRESDRLVRHWRSATGRPATRLASDAVTARAWAMLFAARDERPDWAGELPPLDLDAEAEAHREVLAKRTPGPRAQTLREHAAAAEQAAAAGDTGAALAALARWAEVARELPRPDVATLAACRHVAPLLVRGALAVDPDWAWNYAGALIAALTTRYRSERDRRDWRDLIAEIMRLRGEPGVVPPPASPAAIADAERRLGVRLPAEYRQFLLTCDGLRADVVFPRLLGVSELAGTGSAVTISDPPVIVLRPGTGEVAEWDELFGTTVHSGIRALLEEHLRLLEASAEP